MDDNSPFSKVLHFGIVVRDMDKAVRFFSEKLGIQFIEVMGPPDPRELGMRAALSPRFQMELISPVYPLPEGAPPHIQRAADMLKDRDNVLMSLAFRVQDADKTTVELQQKGLRVETSFDLPAIDEWSMRDIKEQIMVEEDTLGISMGFVEYKSLK